MQTWNSTYTWMSWMTIFSPLHPTVNHFCGNFRTKSELKVSKSRWSSNSKAVVTKDITVPLGSSNLLITLPSAPAVITVAFFLVPFTSSVSFRKFTTICFKTLEVWTNFIFSEVNCSKLWNHLGPDHEVLLTSSCSWLLNLGWVWIPGLRRSRKNHPGLDWCYQVQREGSRQKSLFVL